jgi:RND superfamily putative drug exporter
VTELTEVSVYSVNVVTMLGLGLAVDYSLLVISRFREERAVAGGDVAVALQRTLATAGRTVTFSGLTVAASLAGLLLFAEPFLRSLAWAGIGVVVTTLLAAVTLVPALLAMWGRRIRPAAPARPDRGLFYRLSRLVQRFALAIVPLLALALLLLAVPFRHAVLGNAGLEALPRSSVSRQLFEATRSRFPGGGTEPITLVAQADPRSPVLTGLLGRVQALPGVRSVAARPGLPAALAVVDVLPAGASQGAVATGLVERIRGLRGALPVAVTGPAAFLVDYRQSLVARLPYALATIGLATLVLLFLMTGSLVVPVKAVVMNVLSLGASFGALVWVFQEGHLESLLRFESPGMVDLTVPVLIFVFAFGLSMDYEVFLLARIKEFYDLGGDNDRAVALGLQRSGRIVTSAAALIVVVFLGFAAGELLTIKEIGVGMAIAVVLDATVVRMLLVPATMKLLGRWNWWAPAALRRVQRRVGLVDEPPPAVA